MTEIETLDLGEFELIFNGHYGPLTKLHFSEKEAIVSEFTDFASE